MINRDANSPTAHHLFIRHTCLTVYMPTVQSGAAPKDKSTPRITDSNALNHMDTFIIRRPGEKQSEVAENNTGQ